MANGENKISGPVQSRNKSGSLTFAPKAEDWEQIIALKHAWEKKLGRMVSISDVVRFCIRHTATMIKDLLVPTEEQPTPVHVRAKEDCETCHGIPSGEYAQCGDCGKSLRDDICSRDLVSAGKAFALVIEDANRNADKGTKRTRTRKRKGG